jgi:hypothetical protein
LTDSAHRSALHDEFLPMYTDAVQASPIILHTTSGAAFICGRGYACSSNLKGPTGQFPPASRSNHIIIRGSRSPYPVQRTYKQLTRIQALRCLTRNGNVTYRVRVGIPYRLAVRSNAICSPGRKQRRPPSGPASQVSQRRAAGSAGGERRGAQARDLR